MRIALVAPLVTPIVQPFVGGAQAVVAALGQGLQQRGHDVTCFARQGSNIPGVKIEHIDVPESVLPTNFSRADEAGGPDPGFFSQANIFLDLFLRLQTRQNEFDLVHSHAYDWPAFTLSALLKSLPVIHTIHLPAIVPEICKALHVLHQNGHPIQLVTVSRSCASTYAPYTPFDAIVYNGLSLEAIPFVDQVADDAPLLFAGRITPEKGVVEAIKIARQANCRLLIAGGIYDQAYFTEQVQPLLHQFSTQVTYLGQLDHSALWKIMGQVRGLLFPITWDEPFGLTPVEAMAAGTPIIAFARGAVDEVIIHQKTGFLVPPDDIEQAVSAVSQLATLSRVQCRAHVTSNFSLHAMLDAYEDYYQSLA